MVDLRTRANLEELLDRPDIPFEELKRSFTDLEMANRWLGGARAVLRHILPILPDVSSVLDVACGSADILRTLSDKSDHPIELTGIDISPSVLAIARSKSSDYPEIQLLQADARKLPFEDGAFDVVMSSTFLHHLAPDDVVKFLREAARVSRMRVVVSDLMRKYLAWFGASVAGKILFGHLSRFDAPVSVRRAYTPDELLGLAKKAGLIGSRVHTGLIRMALVYDKRNS